MANFDVFDLAGNKVEQVEADFTPISFNVDFLKDCLYKLNKKYFVKTANTKTKVSKTTRKPWKQKGTGRARQGSLAGPHFRGGRVIFGPLAIQRNVKIQKSEIARAKKMLFSKVIASGSLFVVNSALVSDYKTKNTVAIQKAFGNKKTLFIHNREITELNLISARNVQNFQYSSADSLTIYDFVSHDVFLITKESLKFIVS